jgi:flagella basal body P-ring formation protein FlgA
MKYVSIPLLALLLAGCAGTPPAKPGDAPKPVTSVASANSTDKNGAVTADKIMEMKKEGYTIANQNGETYFCRRELKTGSRLARETVCLTEREIDEIREQTQRGLSNVMRQQAPPQGK